MGCACVLLATGTNEAIIRVLQFERVELYDWLSIPFQQTARVAKNHRGEIPQKEQDAINGMLDFSKLHYMYQPTIADSVKWTAPRGRTEEDAVSYLKNMVGAA